MAKVAESSQTRRGGSKPGERRGGRKKGTPNKTTKLVKEAIIEAAEALGEDGKGKNGTTGYLKTLAVKEPKAFATLLGRVLPMEVTGRDGEPITVKFETTYESSPNR